MCNHVHFTHVSMCAHIYADTCVYVKMYYWVDVCGIHVYTHIYNFAHTPHTQYTIILIAKVQFKKSSSIEERSK